MSNTRWPNECNMLDPAFWTQLSGTKIYPESLKNKLSPCWHFKVPFKINSRVTLSERNRTAVPESGNCNSKCAVSKGLAPDTRNLRRARGVAFQGLDLQKILRIHWRHAPESFEHKKGYLFEERLLKLSSLRHSRLCSFTIL